MIPQGIVTLFSGVDLKCLSEKESKNGYDYTNMEQEIARCNPSQSREKNQYKIQYDQEYPHEREQPFSMGKKIRRAIK
jgi:hypothetical protein